MEKPGKLRDLLRTAPSPDPRHDYLAGFDGAVGDATIGVVYVPDRLTVTADSVAVWLAAFPTDPAPEALALALLDDLNNELVPRWVRVAVRRDRPLRCWAVVDDRQPTWDNPTLLAALPFQTGGGAS